MAEITKNMLKKVEIGKQIAENLKILLKKAKISNTEAEEG